MLTQHTIRSIITLTLLIIVTGCERHNQAQFYGLGTYISVQVHSKPEQAKQFTQELEKLTQEQEKQFYGWGTGELGALNKALSQAKCFANPSTELVALLTQAKNLNQLSDSLFEPAIAPLVELWNFHDSKSIRNEVPPNADIQTQVANLFSISHLEITDELICSSSKTEIDLGAIGKGWGAKSAALLLEHYKINNALIDFGGDLILRGNNTNKKNWTIGLRDPNGQQAPASFSLQTEQGILAVFTSGDYERVFESEGERYHHILDPRTGYPAKELRSVTVIDPNPLLADAAATALFIAGKDWPSIAKKMGIREVLVIFKNQDIEITPALQKKTQWHTQAYKIKVVDIYE